MEKDFDDVLAELDQVEIAQDKCDRLNVVNANLLSALSGIAEGLKALDIPIGALPGTERHRNELLLAARAAIAAAEEEAKP